MNRTFSVKNRPQCSALAMRINQHKATSLLLGLLAVVLCLMRVASAQADAFIETGPMSSARFLPTATLLASGQVLVAGGGGNPIFELVPTAEIYDPAMR